MVNCVAIIMLSQKCLAVLLQQKRRYLCFPNLQDNVQELAYMTAWVGPKGDFDGKTGNYLIQKITGLKPGLYRVNCQGFYFNPGNQNDKNNTSFVFASQNMRI